MIKHIPYGCVLEIEDLPRGYIRYGSLDYCKYKLPHQVVVVLKEISSGLQNPVFSYHCELLEKGEHIGHGKWHYDGRGSPLEKHRLLIVGNTPTSYIEDGAEKLMEPNKLWEYSGSLYHRAIPTEEKEMRVLLRASEIDMFPRNYWVSK